MRSPTDASHTPRHPHGSPVTPRTARGRCGLLLLHRGGLSPPTPCRFRRRTRNLDFCTPRNSRPKRCVRRAATLREAFPERLLGADSAPTTVAPGRTGVSEQAVVPCEREMALTARSGRPLSARDLTLSLLIHPLNCPNLRRLLRACSCRRCRSRSPRRYLKLILRHHARWVRSWRRDGQLAIEHFHPKRAARREFPIKPSISRRTAPSFHR